MDTQSLVAVGLSRTQAEAYALLLELGELKPPEAANHLKISRTNAYKVLDKLVELKLATRTEDGKKAAYIAGNPIALANLTAKYRAEAVAREEIANSIMHELLAKYHTRSDQPYVTTHTGRKDVAAAYRKQLNLHEDIYFIHTKADVLMMGFDTMHEIRVTPARKQLRRHGILAAPADDGPINHKQHQLSNLDITWAEAGAYDSPVEWSVTKSSLLIVLYATEPHAILIVDPIVASAFMQLWRLLSKLLQQQPSHQQHSLKNKK